MPAPFKPCSLKERRATFAKDFLKAMIQSPPVCNRLEVDKDRWASTAAGFADALVRALEKRGQE